MIDGHRQCRTEACAAIGSVINTTHGRKLHETDLRVLVVVAGTASTADDAGNHYFTPNTPTAPVPGQQQVPASGSPEEQHRAERRDRWGPRQ